MTPVVVDDAALARLVALESAVVRYDDPPPSGADGLAVLPGSRPVLLSAPHAVRHWRGEAWKREDEYTAAIVHWLHEQTGAHALYPTHRITPDPHDDGDLGRYKQRLRDVVRGAGIRLVIDVHGARGDRDFGLALGTIYGQTCPPYESGIIAAAEGAGFAVNGRIPSLDRLAVNPARYAGGSHRATVTRFTWQQIGVPAAQLEINAWGRVVERLPSSTAAKRGSAPHFRGDPARIKQTLAALLAIINLVE